MNLATEDERLNLAAVLMFAEQPERITPQFVIKTIRYPGNEIHSTDYVDTEDFAGPLRKVFDDALEAWPHIDFMDDQEGCLFTVTVHQKVHQKLKI